MGLIADLATGPIGVDSPVFIYFIEENPRYLRVIEPLFEEVHLGKRSLITSAVTLLEVLVVPYRLGNFEMAKKYEALLTRSRGVHLMEISRDHLRAAAQLRAAMKIKTPDSLQIMAALSAGCSTFLTNDRDLPTVPGIRILQLDSYV